MVRRTLSRISGLESWRSTTSSPKIGCQLVAALEHAHAQGALKALKVLILSGNLIGDEGMRHLGDALARGAAPALEELNLGSNPASDAAKKAVEDALQKRGGQ